MMNIRRLEIWPCAALAVTLGFSCIANAASGEPIRFSKPAVPIAVQEKEIEVVTPRARGMDFPNANFEQPMVVPRQQPPMMRHEKNDEHDDTPKLLRIPRIYSDPDEQKNGKERDSHPLAAKRGAASDNSFKSPSPNPRFGGESANPSRGNDSRALSPVTDFDWKPEESRTRQQDLPWQAARNTQEREAHRERERESDRSFNPFARREETRFDSDTTGSRWSMDFATPRLKEKMTPAQLERRAAFEQLINPTIVANGKGLDSLQPVINADDAKAATMAIPTLGVRGTLEPRSDDPMSDLNRRHERLRGPIAEDINRKYSSQSKPSPTQPYESVHQTPLLRQPLTREFPTRKGY